MRGLGEPYRRVQGDRSISALPIDANWFFAPVAECFHGKTRIQINENTPRSPVESSKTEVKTVSTNAKKSTRSLDRVEQKPTEVHQTNDRIVVENCR